MINDFLKFPQEEQRKLFIAAAYQTGLSPTVIEKDLWVYWALSKLLLTLLKYGSVNLQKVSFSKYLIICNRKLNKCYHRD